MTAAELLRLPEVSERYELRRGELLRFQFASALAGITAANLAAALLRYVKERGLGICGGRAGFQLGSGPDTVRAPGIWFVRSSRIPAAGIPDGFWPGAPDLAIEVLSPWDALLATMERVEDFLGAGTPLQWVVDPAERMLGVFRPGMPATFAGEDGVLDGGDVVPGFAVTLRDVLP